MINTHTVWCYYQHSYGLMLYEDAKTVCCYKRSYGRVLYVYTFWCYRLYATCGLGGLRLDGCSREAAMRCLFLSPFVRWARAPDTSLAHWAPQLVAAQYIKTPVVKIRKIIVPSGRDVSAADPGSCSALEREL